MKRLMLITALIFTVGSSPALVSGQTLTLDYSTYLGGSGSDRGNGISLGTDGRVYLTGYTTSSDFPIVSPYQASHGGGNIDAFVTALSSTGSTLLYSTYLGGSGDDEGWGISVGTDGSAYLIGVTSSYDFPTVNPYQASYGGIYFDAFVAALSSTGSVLLYSTYLGGSSTDFGDGISLGTDGTAYLTGDTFSSDFPTVNPYQAGCGGYYDAFVSALSSTGSVLLYSTYLGGSGSDWGEGISLGTDGRAYLTGLTDSFNFPTVNPYQVGYGGGDWDIFVSALSSTGSVLCYSTYLGGSSDDYGPGISLKTDGSAYLTGYTHSFNFPTVYPYQASCGGSIDVFVSSLSSTGSSLCYSTYLGGSSDDYGLGISLGTDGRAYLTGFTDSFNFPTVNPYQAGYGGGDWDVFVSALSPTGSVLCYSTYLGGSGDDLGREISVGADGVAYLTGSTGSSDFPTVNPYQAGYGGGDYDAFVSKLRLITPTPTPTPYGYKTPTPSPSPSPSAPVLDEGFDDFHTGTRPVGWSFINCNSNSDTYTTGGNYGKALPSLKLDATGDKVITKTFSQPDDLYFWIKGQSVDATSALLVEEYYSSSWNQITDISNLPTTGTTEGPFALNGSTIQLQFRYYKSLGDLAFDDVRVTAHTPTPTPEGYKTPTPTPSPDGGKRIAITPVTGSTLSPPTTPSTAPEPTATPIEELLLADAGDYDGDGTVDPAVFRPASGLWSIRDYTRLYFGRPNPGDLPASGDYDGDGTADIAIFRPASGLWSVRDITRAYFGVEGDSLIPGDYDGDGVCDIAVFRATTGLWAIRGLSSFYFGIQSDQPIPGDYDGDGTADIGIFRSSAGLWKIMGITLFYFGGEGDIAVAGDYDGNGSLAAGVFRPASGLWAIRGITRLYFGEKDDQLLTGDYDGDLVDDIAIFRESVGLWAVEGVTRVYLSPDRPHSREDDPSCQETRRYR